MAGYYCFDRYYDDDCYLEIDDKVGVNKSNDEKLSMLWKYKWQNPFQKSESGTIMIMVNE